MLEKKLLEEARREYDLKRTICLVSDEKQNSLVCDLINYPHAFVLAAIMDRQITFERAWAIPYLIKEKLGDFSLNILYSLSLEDYKKLFNDNKLHRYNEKMAEIFYLLGICFVKGKSLQGVIYKNVCMCYSGYIKK